MPVVPCFGTGMLHIGRGVVPLSLLILVACGDAGTGERPSGGAGGVGAGNGGGGAEDVGGAFGVGGHPSGSSGNAGSGGACAGETSKPQLSPLDMYIMLDS